MHHPTSFMRNNMPWSSDFLITALEKADQFHVPHEVQTSHHWIFLWVFIKNLIYTEKISDLCHLWERINTNASTNMARNCDLSRYSQGYKWWAHWDLLRYVWKHWEFMDTLQQITSLHLSSHKSYCVWNVGPSSFMILYMCLETVPAIHNKKINSLKITNIATK